MSHRERESATTATTRERAAPRDGAVAMSDDPDELRLQIADTRRRLGDTVQELAQKADVKSQVREQVEERKRSLRETRASVARAAPRAAIAAAALAVVVMLVRRRR